MTAFWLYAGVLCAAALAFILVPQLHRLRGWGDTNRTHVNVSLYHERLGELETQHAAGALNTIELQAGRIEAARDLLGDVQVPKHAAGGPLGRTVPLIAALSMPLLTLVLYLHWGSLDQLMLARQHPANSPKDIEGMTAHVEALLATNSDSSEGWALLGRAYMAQKRMADAARAFERATTLAGRPAELLGRWAEALYFAGGRQWTPQLQALTDEALASNPREATSLKLAGIAAFQESRYAEAVTDWERLAATLPEQDSDRAVITEDIARARELNKSATAKEAPP